MTKRASLVLLLCLTFPLNALAQFDDDDLVPLGPSKPKTKAKPKAKAKPKPKTTKKPVIDDDDDLLVPLATTAAEGTLNVKLPAAISGAVLSVDGKNVGTLPMELKVKPGEHTLTVKRPGYAAFVKKVQVVSGKTVNVDAKLSAVAAVLSVTSDVAGAQVLLNGRNIGQVPLVDVEVPAGPAELEVVKEGFDESRQKITFVAGRDYPVNVKLAREEAPPASDAPLATNLVPSANEPDPLTQVSAGPEPITAKWYFWVGIGVAVAAAIVVPIVATEPGRQREAFCGNIAGADTYIGLPQGHCSFAP